MAEKSEKATPKKLRDAKKKGQVAKSQDLPAAATFIVSIAATIGFMPSIYNQIGEFLKGCFSLVTHPDIPQILGAAYGVAIYTIFSVCIPIVVIVTLVGMLVTFLSVGPVFAPEVFKFDIKKFNPVENLKAKFKLKTFVELLKSIAKLLVATILVYQVVENSIPVLIHAYGLNIYESIDLFAYFLWEVVKRVGLFFIAVAIFDFMYQKHNFGKEMMMEKFEVKQEYKETEGNPEIKGKRREVAREIAYSESPAAGAAHAKAVVTNPHALAIALGFDPELDPCPFVLAMGKGILAEQIIKIAENKEIPIIRNISLAHTLWEKAKVFEYIPEESYEAVAEIISWLAELAHEEEVKALKF